MDLTKNQQIIIESISIPLLITAPAGAGKTEVMARRCVNAFNLGKKNILCLTFTNRAANSMKRRINTLAGKRLKATVCTFHSFCNSLIRAESKSLGLPFQYTILDEEDSNAVLLKIMLKYKDRVSEHDIKAAKSIIDDYRNACLVHKENISILLDRFKTRFSFDLESVLAEYNSILLKSNSLDFTSLITITYEFLSNKENLRRWQKIYDFIQVDEMQDTGIIEYDIFSKLALPHKNLSLFGDTDQTIYEWRDSRPFEILEKFREEFKPKEYILNHNFRSSKNIAQCSEQFLINYFEKADNQINVINDDGDKVKLCFLKNSDYEKKQVCKIVSKLNKDKTPFKDIAILTRTNKDAREFSHALVNANIPSYIIDEYNFFRREEIKDAISALKLLNNKRDIEAAKRTLSKYAKNIGETTINDILSSPYPISLEDFILGAHKEDDDFMEPIITPYLENRMVVFDVESTGLDTEKDEIVEIAAVKFGVDGVLDEFHHYIKNTIPVGASEVIHGYSDEFLVKAGKDAKDVLNEFLEFSKGSVLSGHNVGYDIAILKSHLSRLKIKHDINSVSFNTLDAAKRILKDADNYKLGTLCAHFGIEEEPTHHAMDDVWATCELADICYEQILGSAEIRKEIYAKYKEKFKPFAKTISNLMKMSETYRPDELLNSIIDKLEIKKRYNSASNKSDNLDELVKIFTALDDMSLSINGSVKKLLEIATLSNSGERLIGDNDKVAVLTVHQAKGLQFSSVIIVNAVEGVFPSSLNIKYEKTDEEARLFYVAMTRASKSLFITLSAENENGEKNKSSRFIKYLSKEYYKIFSQDI
jgi:DNA helicase II / ATP-dependent DNA helicase PcrA